MPPQPYTWHMGYKVVFVDWDGTLSESRFWGRWAGTLRYQQIQETLFRDGRNLLQDWMRGRITYATILRHVADKTGIPYKALEDELRYSAENMSYINPSVIEVVQKIRANDVKVVIATDNMDTFQRWTASALQLNVSFDGILTSNTQGALKADFNNNGTSAFFLPYFLQSGVDPAKTVLIDDSLDAKVVERIGMEFLHVTEATPLTHHLARILAQQIR